MQNSWTGLVISYVLFILIIGLLVYYLIDSGEKQSFSTFPISLQNIILFAILLGCSVWVGHFLSQNLPTPVNHIQNLQAREQIQSMSSALIFAKMFGMVFIVIWEELIFRGLVMKTYFKDSPYGWDIFYRLSSLPAFTYRFRLLTPILSSILVLLGPYLCSIGRQALSTIPFFSTCYIIFYKGRKI